MALPTTGINTTLVKNELGASTHKVSELCTHANINMWSKRKPVRDSDISVTYADVGRANDTWGLNVPLFAFSNDDSQLWIYERPRGGASEPYRLGDFRGYNHNAVNPVLIPSAPSQLNEQFNVTALMVDSTDTALSIADLYGNLRLGLVVYNELGNIIDWASAQSATGGIDVDLAGYVNADTVTVKFFLVDVYKAWGDPSISHTKYSLPRANTSENQFWYDIPVQANQTQTEPERFDVMWLESTNELTVNLDTYNYTGDVKVTINEVSSGNGVTVVTFTQPSTDLYTHTEINSNLQPLTEYQCLLSFWNGSSWDYKDTFTFTTFGSM